MTNVNPNWSDISVSLPTDAKVTPLSPWEGILAERHPSTQHLARMLQPNPALAGPLRAVAVEMERLATVMIRQVPDGPELTVGLRKLLEAKDAFVRGLL